MQEPAPTLSVNKRTAQFGVVVIVTLIVTCLVVLVTA